MKLATLRDGSRDGQLVVVSRDLAQAHYASGIVGRLQQALDDWNFFAPQLQDLYDELNSGRARQAFALDVAQCLAPLPRAYRWQRESAYASHRTHCPETPPVTTDAGDAFAPPRATVFVADDEGFDFSAGLAAITGDVLRGAAPEQAAEGVRLLTLALVLLRPGEPNALASAFAAVAVTPDELGDAWRGARAHLTLQVQVNERNFGLCETGQEMARDFGACIARSARDGVVAAGGIVGALPVSNADATRGYCSLAEKRGAEAAGEGAARTPWLRAGDGVRVEARPIAGARPLFGAIELRLAGRAPLQAPEAALRAASCAR